MRRFLLTIALLFFAGSAWAQSSIEQLSLVPTFPFPDSASTTSHAWITQGCLTPTACDYKATPEQLGAIHQGTTAPASPFSNQLWFDTNQSPAALRQWNGSNFGAVGGIGLVSVTSFGVKGDGSDQTANLTAAINATAGNGCLFFPQPSVGYAVNTASSSIILPNGMCIQGDGGGSRIFALSTSTHPMFQMAQGGVLRISDIELDGNQSSGANVACFTTDPTIGATGIEMDRTAVMNCAKDGVIIDGSATASANVQIHNSFISNNGLGLSLRHVTNFNIDNGSYAGNVMWGIGCQLLDSRFSHGTDGALCTKGTISGNYIANNGCGGVNTWPGLIGFSVLDADSTILNNVVSGNCGSGIRWGGARMTISANHLLSNGNDGSPSINTGAVGLYTTGTVTVTNGSTAVTGVGTSWFGYCASTNSQIKTVSSNGAQIFLANIFSIDSNTSITLSAPWGGSNGASQLYQLICPMSNSDIIISGNTIEGIGTGADGIAVNITNGGSIANNVMDDATGANGIQIFGAGTGGVVQGLSVTGNAISQKSNAGIEAAAATTYNAGTVAVSNGGSTVTLTGGSFNNIPGAQYFRATVDDSPHVYAVTAQTPTTLTITPTYVGTGGSGLAYVAQSEPSFNVNMTGNSISGLSTPYGIAFTGCIDCSAVGNGVRNSVTANFLESGTSFGNLWVGTGLTTTLSNLNTFALHSASDGDIQLQNLPTTPGSKKAVCIDSSTGKLYIASSGSTC